MLPWLTVFQGLHSYSGTVGLNGRILAAGGGAAVVLALAYALRSRAGLHYAIGILGFALTLFSGYLLAELLVTYDSLRGMFLPALGPGVFVATAGALMILATLFVEPKSRQQRERRSGVETQAVTLVALSAGAGAIHLAVASDHFHEYVLYGVFFVVLGVAQTVWAALIAILGPSRYLLLAAIANAGVVALWVASRTTALPLGPHPRAPEAIGFPDVSATLFEVALVGLSVWSLRRRTAEPSARIMRLQWALPLAVSPMTIAAVLVAVGAIGQ
jgi:hypothetical protein